MANNMLQYQVESCAVYLHYTNIALLQIQVQFYLKAGMFEHEQKKNTHQHQRRYDINVIMTNS